MTHSLDPPDAAEVNLFPSSPPDATTPDSQSPSPSAPRLPNIVFLLADDLGHGDPHYAGGRALTPNLDQMAHGQHTVRFDRFYSSGPVCSPTRGSLLTGRNHNRFCVWMANTAGKSCKEYGDFACHAKNPLPLSESTVAEILREQGYRTAAFGKWHLGDLVSSPEGGQASGPGENGFEVWKVTERAVPTSTPNCGCFNASLCNLGHYAKKEEVFPCTNYQEPAATSGSVKAHPEIILKDDSDFIVDQFAEFLNETASKNERPFFAYIPLHSVHKHFVATPPYDAPYRSNATLSWEEVDYYSSISAMDSAVGRVRELLSQHAVRNRTMLWFASDNGPAPTTPGSTGGLRGRKGSLYEGGIRVPGLVEWPGGIHKNQVTSFPATTSDFLPTMLDLVGVSSNRTLDGMSLLPLLQHPAQDDTKLRYQGRGEDDPIRTGTIKWAFNIRGDFDGRFSAAIMNNQFKLIASYKRGEVRSYSLYNLSQDPSESQDLSQQGSYIPLCSSMLFGLEEWLASVRTSATQEVGCLHTT